MITGQRAATCLLLTAYASSHVPGATHFSTHGVSKQTSTTAVISQNSTSLVVGVTLPPLQHKSRMPGKTAFQRSWLVKTESKSWIMPDKNDPYSAHCTFCNKTFSIASMGFRAVTSHASGKKHQQAVQCSVGTVSVAAAGNQTVQDTLTQQQPSDQRLLTVAMLVENI
jgi:hypothetical protein